MIAGWLTDDTAAALTTHVMTIAMTRESGKIDKTVATIFMGCNIVIIRILFSIIKHFQICPAKLERLSFCHLWVILYREYTPMVGPHYWPEVCTHTTQVILLIIPYLSLLWPLLFISLSSLQNMLVYFCNYISD